MKKILLFSAVTLGAMFASADESYLYWMIGDTKGWTYDAAKIRVLKNDEATDSYLQLYYANGTSAGDSISETYASSASEAGLGMYAAFGGFLGQAYSYIIELSNDGTFVAQTDALTYSSLGSYIVQNGIGVPGIGEGAAWSTATYSIPEPTSGIMMLLGVAALALRRRRRA